MGVLISGGVHLLVIVILGVMLQRMADHPRQDRVVIQASVLQPVEPLTIFEPVPITAQPATVAAETTWQREPAVEIPSIPVPQVTPSPTIPVSPPSEHVSIVLVNEPNVALNTQRPTSPNGRQVQPGGLDGRQGAARARLLARYGGTEESEQAVQLGLAWLANHQHPDGGWRFDLKSGPCQGRCSHSGSVRTSTGATALALLPFLGAGQLPDRTPYGDVVTNGLDYLADQMRMTPYGGDLQQGTMYSQGLAAIALCEAYSLTGDPRLKPAAQSTIDFIGYAQHEQGGWRYFPKQAGDTTVFGWQLMALKSASLAGLQVPASVTTQAEHYLDTVQTDGGAGYGYQEPVRAATPTAVGLLSRMYLGWTPDDPRLTRGIDYLQTLGPSRTDMYYNYYATQVLFHYDAPEWSSWNESLRQQLIDTQSVRGHERGSWYFNDQHALAGGRLYNTAICLLILEVYYRHLPLYGEEVREQRSANVSKHRPEERSRIGF